MDGGGAKRSKALDVAAVLDDHRRRFGSAFGASAIGMATVSFSGEVAQQNSSFERFFASKPLRAGDRFEERLLPEDASRFQEALQSIATGGAEAVAPTLGIMHDAEVRRVLLVITGISKNAGSRADYALLQMIDQSGRHEAEDEARLLLDVARALTSTSAIEAGAAYVCEKLAHATDASVVAIWLANPAEHEPIATAPPGKAVEHELSSLARKAWADEVDLWSADPDSNRAHRGKILTAMLATHELKCRAVLAAQLPAASDTHRMQRLMKRVSAQLGPWVALISSAAALRQSEERHRVLIESANEAIVGSDASGRIVLWNESAASMFGYEPKAILGKPVTTIIPARFRQQHDNAFPQAVASGCARRNTLHVAGMHADGREFPIEAAFSVAGTGNEALAFGVIRNVSQQLEVLSQLRENERRLKEAEHVANMGSFEWDVATDKISWSEELYRIYGLDQKTSLGTFNAFLEHLHPDDREAVTEKVTKAIAEGKDWAMDERIVRADDGEVRTLATIGHPVVDENGKVVRLCGICHDVTEQRLAELALRQSEERFRLLVEGVRDYAIVLLDRDGKIVTWNDGATNVTGYTSAESIREHIEIFFPLEDRGTGKVTELLRAASETGSAETEGWQVRRDGKRYWALTLVTRLIQDDETMGYAVLTRDVSERREFEAALAESEERFRHGFDDAPIGMLIVTLLDGDALVKRTNSALSYLLGYSMAEMTAMKMSQLTVSEDWPLFRQTLQHAAENPATPIRHELRMRGVDARKPLVAASASRIESDGDDLTLIVHVEDVTEQKAAEERLRHRALHDALTGLPNRDLLLDRLTGALARAGRTDSSVAVLFLDLDNFKLINDSMGHTAGDTLLQAVAKRLQEVGRSVDTAARVGGDEFVVVCENIVHEDEILLLVRRVTEALAAPVTISENELVVTASIGIALGSEYTHSPEQLLRDADLAMYRAKQRGRNTVELFDEKLRRHAIDRVEIERQLRSALREREIVPYFQPIIALDTGTLVGFEALARWNHPQRGLLAPAEFLSIAEEAHLIGALGAQMLRAACTQLATWQKAVPELIMSVNLSLQQLDGHFADLLKGAIEEARILPDSLHLEVTESVILDISRSSGTDLSAIAKLGAKIGIDDFGTGYSSLLYLKRFPVSFVKIDRSFVDGLPDESEDTAIVDAIVRLSQSLQLVTVAEGVENVEQLAALRRIGCTHAQGVFIAPPLAPAAGSELLHEGRRW